MRDVIPVIEIDVQTAHEGCGHCLHSETGRACAAADAHDHCDNPVFKGPADQVELAMAALARVMDPDTGRDVVSLRLVAGLAIEADSAELLLTVFPHCGGGRVISAGCFEALRGALPDTDIYVLHRPATPGRP